MWGRKPKIEEQAAASAQPEPAPLKDAVRQVRIELAEQSAVVVDLRDAALARLELLNEALDPLFGEIPPEVELFDRGISRGDTPRLWIDAVAHVVMGRDKRRYRFVQDTRYGRKVLAESNDIKETVDAVTHYVAARLVERERALAEGSNPLGEKLENDMRIVWRKRRWRMIRAFLFGLMMGCLALFGALWLLALRLQP
jgi:hypothetical protein